MPYRKAYSFGENSKELGNPKYKNQKDLCFPRYL